MNNLIFNYENTCGLSKFDLVRDSEKLSSVLNKINDAASSNDYDSVFSSINLPFDRKTFLKVNKLAGKYKNVSCVVIVGIGGSNLGTMAVQEAVLGKFHNLISSDKPKVLYADTIDSDSMNKIIQIIESELRNKKMVLINCVTKSGSTTETIVNFSILLELLKKYVKKYKEYIVITTDKDSVLYNLAVKEKYNVLEVPKNVGGRYSVLSPVGLFPLAVLGINIEKLLEGSRVMRNFCISKDILKNPAAVSALVLYTHYKRNRNIHNTFLFANDLEALGKWYRQLMGESIGKEKDVSGRTVKVGITPTVAIGSTDLHSMAQLYLGGPEDKVTTFVSIKHFNETIKVPENELSNLVPSIVNKELDFTMQAIVEGVKKSYENRGLPFMEIVLPNKSAYYLGQLLQFKMIEMIYLGHLLNVNPFDQPNVEEYKEETKNILEAK